MNKFQTALITTATVATLGLTTLAPASADSAASTRNIIGIGALLAGIAIESNVAHKNTVANNVIGYTRDGGTVYGDNRIVDRNGQTYYPNDNNQTLSCNNGSCVVYNNQNAQPNGYNGDARRWDNRQDNRQDRNRDHR